jgi:hypothetical protein
LAIACSDDWATAADVLQRGFLEGFLGQIGRADLAAAAREGARFPDANLGLDYFLAKIPNRVLPQPKLSVEPANVQLGALSVGKDCVFHLRLKNLGKRLLHGWIASQCGWLTIGDGAGVQAKLFQFGNEQSIAIHIKGKLLRASSKPLEGKLVVESNGGNRSVAITANVPVKVFAEGVLAGAASPRELVHKIKAAPQAAVALFESGAAHRWYRANGWPYPVRGTPVEGVGAIQQFLEGLGLLRPPNVLVGEKFIALKARPGEHTQHALQLHGMDNQLVWAHAVSDQPWLEVGHAVSAPGGATVPLLIRSVPDQPGATLTAQVTVTTNGNQRFQLPVHLTVNGKTSFERAAAPIPPVALPSPRTPQGGTAPMVPSRKARAYWFALAFLVFGFSGTLIHDWLVQFEQATSFSVAPLIDTQPRISLHFHDDDIAVKLGPSGIKPSEGAADRNHIPATWEPSMRFGLTMVGQPDPGRPGYDKRLTYSERGLTNNTCVRLDGNEWLFGEAPFRLEDGKREGPAPGYWREMKEPLKTDPTTGLKIEGAESVWLYSGQKIAVTQTVEIVPGDQSRLLDTCLVRYRFDNEDNRPHRLGLRVLLDTYIGANDGVPFTIPGATGLCDTEMQFPLADQVPDFIEALERPDLRDPGTIAHLGLKRTSRFDPPDRLTLGAWPNFRLHGQDHRCLQEKTLWEVPILPIKSLSPADSAVAIYWNEKDLLPGEHREMAFTYGLGNVSSNQAEGKLGISVGGSFVEEGEFTVTAYVNHPSPGENVALSLPDGFRLLAGASEQVVPPPLPGAASPNSPVTWRVTAPGKAGQYDIRVRSSSGVAQTQPLTIRPRGGIFE